MFRTSVSLAAVALVLVGFAGCGGSERHFGGSTGGKSGASQGGNGGDTLGGNGGRGGHGGVDAEAGEGGAANEAGAAGSADEAGAGGMAGDSNVDSTLEIAAPALTPGKTYVPFTGSITARGATRYSWSLGNSALPAGVTLQGTQTATVTLAGTPTEAGQFPITLRVTDGTNSKTVDVTLVITHTALFLSDRNVSGVSELFLTEIGGDTAPAPVRLSASFPQGGGVASYSWSPDGSKVMYFGIQPANGISELWVASLASPGTAQRVSVAGAAVSQAVWLGAGNIAAYTLASGDTYLTDLSQSPPTPGKLVLMGKGSGAAVLRPSPNGTSVGIQMPGTNANDIAYATWSPMPTTVSLVTVQGSGPYFSFDGKYALVLNGPSGYWFDLSSTAPAGVSISSSNGLGYSWSPNAETLFLATGSGPAYEFSRGDFVGGGMTKTALASPMSCSPSSVRWSPDGKSGLFGCSADVRGINNLPTAVAGQDFSLLPSGFLSKSYTDTLTSGWSPDSKWIALRADRDADMQYDLQLIRWSTPGVAYKPHANTLSAGIANWVFAQNSQAIAFVGTVSPQANAALYLSKLPASGAPPNATLVSSPAASVVQTDVSWLPGSRVIAYRAVVPSGGSQLFAVPVSADGSAGIAVPVSGASGGGVSSYLLAPVR